MWSSFTLFSPFQYRLIVFPSIWPVCTWFILAYIYQAGCNDNFQAFFYCFPLIEILVFSFKKLNANILLSFILFWKVSFRVIYRTIHTLNWIKLVWIFISWHRSTTLVRFLLKGSVDTWAIKCLLREWVNTNWSGQKKRFVL